MNTTTTTTKAGRMQAGEMIFKAVGLREFGALNWDDHMDIEEGGAQLHQTMRGYQKLDGEDYDRKYQVTGEDLDEEWEDGAFHLGALRFELITLTPFGPESTAVRVDQTFGDAWIVREFHEEDGVQGRIWKIQGLKNHPKAFEIACRVISQRIERIFNKAGVPLV